MQTSVAAPVVRSVGGTGGAIWPIVIGAISVILAIVDLGLNGVNMLAGLQAGSTGSFLGAFVPLAFALWLLIAGIGVLRRNQNGFANLRRWAIWKTVLFATCLGCLFTMAVVASARLEENLPPDMSGLAEVIFLVLIGAAAFHLAWPIFCIIWTGRNEIQRQVSNW